MLIGTGAVCVSWLPAGRENPGAGSKMFTWPAAIWRVKPSAVTRFPAPSFTPFSSTTNDGFLGSVYGDRGVRSVALSKVKADSRAGGPAQMFGPGQGTYAGTRYVVLKPPAHAGAAARA